MDFTHDGDQGRCPVRPEGILNGEDDGPGSTTVHRKCARTDRGRSQQFGATALQRYCLSCHDGSRIDGSSCTRQDCGANLLAVWKAEGDQQLYLKFS